MWYTRGEPKPLPPMKALLRFTLLLLAGLSLAGCASQTAQVKAPSATPRVASNEDRKPISDRDYWMMRDLNNSFDRARGQP